MKYFELLQHIFKYILILTKSGVRIDDTSHTYEKRLYSQLCPASKNCRKLLNTNKGAVGEPGDVVHAARLWKRVAEEHFYKITSFATNPAAGQFLNSQNLFSSDLCLQRANNYFYHTKLPSHLTRLLPSAFCSFFIASFSFPCPINAHALL